MPSTSSRRSMGSAGSEEDGQDRILQRQGKRRAVAPMEADGGSEGYGSVGSWLAGSADAYIKMRLKTAAPLALGWSIGTFKLVLSSGAIATVRGKLAPPF